MSFWDNTNGRATFAASMVVVAYGVMVYLILKYPNGYVKVTEPIPAPIKYYSSDQLFVFNYDNEHPEILVYDDVEGEKDYYSVSQDSFYSLDQLMGEGFNSIFPLDHYLTEEEKLKSYFSDEDLQIINERITNKDASLTLSKRLV